MQNYYFLSNLHAAKLKITLLVNLNKKNCFVIKQIFNINNEYKLNLYQGDTLNIKTKTFNIKKFDIIIGNPPYNTEFNKEGFTKYKLLK